jgi:hypothetical protein
MDLEREHAVKRFRMLKGLEGEYEDEGISLIVFESICEWTF